jgi:hypothetical protein
LRDATSQQRQRARLQPRLRVAEAHEKHFSHLLPGPPLCALALFEVLAEV